MIEERELAPGYRISRIIKGGWQLSEGHGTQRPQDPVADMFAFAEQGVLTFDCADIYTGVEAMIGEFNAANATREQPLPVRIHTKYVPDYDELRNLDRRRVEAIIDRSLRRLRQERLDMVQFHWWNYAVPGWVEVAQWLQALQASGKIELLSLTNFNTETTREILGAGVRLATTQVQYSLLDARPEKALIPLCEGNGMQLLCYGVLAGGFLSERWLGASDPGSRGDAFENRSLVKYRVMIDEIGGWDLFQALLACLAGIATRHGTDIASVAARWVLDQPQVAAVIIGSRNAAHLGRYRDIFRLRLDARDHSAIDALRSQMRVPALDVFDLERDKAGPHGRIMKYTLNASRGNTG
jgi:aryl-alcohol dehydrogenase-like predicted oxidoreductase